MLVQFLEEVKGDFTVTVFVIFAEFIVTVNQNISSKFCSVHGSRKKWKGRKSFRDGGLGMYQKSMKEEVGSKFTVRVLEMLNVNQIENTVTQIHTTSLLDFEKEIAGHSIHNFFAQIFGPKGIGRIKVDERAKVNPGGSCKLAKVVVPNVYLGMLSRGELQEISGQECATINVKGSSNLGGMPKRMFLQFSSASGKGTAKEISSVTFNNDIMI